MPEPADPPASVPPRHGEGADDEEPAAAEGQSGEEDIEIDVEFDDAGPNSDRSGAAATPPPPTRRFSFQSNTGAGLASFNPFSHPTVPPAVSESEYVAQIMAEADQVEGSPPVEIANSSARTELTAPPRAPESSDTERPGTAPAGDTERPGAPAKEPFLASEPPPSEHFFPSEPPPSEPSSPPSGSSPVLMLDLTDVDLERRASGPPTARRGARAIAPPPAGGPNAIGSAIELVTRQLAAQAEAKQPIPAHGLDEMRSRIAVGNYSGALEVAEQILHTDPGNIDAQRVAGECREVLTRMFLSRLGGWRRIPEVAARTDQFRWLSIDHHAGFLLSLVDGHFTVEELVDASGMPPLDALRILAELLQHAVIRVR